MTSTPQVQAEARGVDAGPPGPTTRRGSLAAQMRRGATVMVVLTTLANVTMYASTLIFSRVLSPEGFGDLTALLALSVVLAVPTSAAMTVIAERVAVYAAEGDTKTLRYLIRHATAHVLTISVVVTAVYIACIPVVDRALDLQAVGAAIALAPLLLVSFLIPVVLGILQGLDRFVAFGLMTLIVPITRIAFGVPWAAADGGAGGALGGQAVGTVLALMGAAWLLRDHLIGRGTGAATSGIRRKPDVRAVSAVAAFAAFALLSNLDIVLAKLVLSSADVGLYAALTSIGKIVLFLPGAVAVVMVPNAARAEHSKESSARVLRIAARLVLVITLLAAVPAAVKPRLILSIMFSSKYEAASSGVLPIVCAGAGMSLLYLLVVYSVAIQDRKWVRLLLLGVALQVGGIFAFHSSPAQVATVQAAVVFVILAVNELWFHPLLRSRALLARGNLFSRSDP